MGQLDDRIRSHGVILAHLMSSPVVQTWVESFELQLLVTMSIPVVSSPRETRRDLLIDEIQILEAIAKPKIRLDWAVLKSPRTSDPLEPPNESCGIAVPSLELRRMATVPDLLRHPENNLAELHAIYCDMRIDQPLVGDYLAELSEAVAATSGWGDDIVGEKLRLFQQYQVVYGILLKFLASLNKLLQVAYPNDPALLPEASIIANEIIILAKNAARYRPLGASYVPSCLATLVSVPPADSCFL